MDVKRAGAALFGTAEEQLRHLASEAAAQAPTPEVREALRRLAGPLGGDGPFDVVEAAVLRRSHSGGRPTWDVDWDLVDAALAAGVPVADPPADVELRLTAWLERAPGRRDLVTVCADARFRPLLRDALLDGRADLLALGRPACPLRDRDGTADAVLGSPGLRGLVREIAVGWAAAARAGSLPALHEALYHLDLLGPARLAAADAETGDAIAGIMRTDLADLLALTWRTGLADELGHRALDAFGATRPGDNVFPVDLTGAAGGGSGVARDGFVVTDGNRTLVLGPEEVVAGPLFGRVPLGGGSVAPSYTYRLDGARIVATPADGPANGPGAAEEYEVPMPGVADDGSGRSSRRLLPGEHGWWELRGGNDAVAGRWLPGPARPARANGSHSVGRHRHRWAGGSELMPPPHMWPHLRPRDEAGSRALRGADRDLAARVLDAVDGELGGRLFEIGRRVPVGTPSREVEDACRDLRRVLRPLLPDVTADRLWDGIAGTVWTAVECRELMARHVEAEGGSAGLRARPRPYPRADAGDLRARIFTDMQRMFERLADVADACADPKVDLPPRHVVLANALGWEDALGRLGGRALRTALEPGTGDDRGDEVRHDHLRAWGVPPVCDPAGRWRALRLRPDRDSAPASGTVCRTPGGCLIVLQSPDRGDLRALEYAADGVFGAPPFGLVTEERVCAGWGGPDRLAALLRLLQDRGPAPWPRAALGEFADATGLSPETAAVLAAGFQPRDAYRARRGGAVPGWLVAVSGLRSERLTAAGRALADLADPDARLQVLELLMPDDPADLWAGRPAVERAAAWWNERFAAPLTPPAEQPDRRARR